MKLRKLLHRLVYGRYLLDLDRISRPLPACTIREYEDSDFAKCCQIYDLNAPGKFPKDSDDVFRKELLANDTLRFVVMLDNDLIGTGGISIAEYTDSLQSAILSFGLIHPEYQSKGIGTALLAYRCSILPRKNWSVSMTSAGNGTELFFKKLGFIYTGKIDCSEYTLDSYACSLPSDYVDNLASKVSKSDIQTPTALSKAIPRKDMRDIYAKEMEQSGQGT